MIQPKRQYKKKVFIVTGITIAALLIICVAVITIITTHQKKSETTQTIIDNPGYSTVLPAGKSISDLGGWRRVSPVSSSPVYAYNDSIDDIAISISEQPLPDSFKDDIDSHVAELAKSDNATNVVKTSNTTLYIGLSAKGPQSVYFSKNNLLILIKSEKQIKNAAWSSYAASLQ